MFKMNSYVNIHKKSKNESVENNWSVQFLNFLYVRDEKSNLVINTSFPGYIHIYDLEVDDIFTLL